MTALNPILNKKFQIINVFTKVGKIYYKPDNLLARDFKASKPMEVLTTDIT